MNKTKIELPERINGNIQININTLSNDEYQIVVRYKGCSYNTFDVYLSAAFERINHWIEKLEMEGGR